MRPGRGLNRSSATVNFLTSGLHGQGCQTFKLFFKNFITFLLHPVAVNSFVNTVHICVNAVVMKSFVTVAFILTCA